MNGAWAEDSKRIFTLLWAAFVVQVAGRLFDFRWHVTHDGFETAGDQVQAHWLMWLGTLFILVVAVVALRSTPSDGERRGYQVVLWSNVLLSVISVIHYLQHLDHQEVDWAHLALAITNIGSVVGVVMVTMARVGSRSRTGDIQG